MIILRYYPVADLGEARPQPTLFLDQMETAPALSQGLDDRPPPTLFLYQMVTAPALSPGLDDRPPPPPLSKSLDPPLVSIH